MKLRFSLVLLLGLYLLITPLAAHPCPNCGGTGTVRQTCPPILGNRPVPKGVGGNISI